ncbi:MAG: alternative ribosome rescue aminoacyl-tRNA hydrolase ArfB [Patescibacteria group bacterium]|nr:alternative ribosome rescue aminoacyl-tRNA hydrolase ArfB [Patescibacteria group bacterium]
MDTANEKLSVPESEIYIGFARSSGPGGQNVNKRATKAVLTWNVGESKAFTEEQKTVIRESFANRLNNDDEMVISSDSERSQERNRKEVIGRLQGMIADALTLKKERKPTKVSKAQKRKRLEDKHKRSDTKKLRKSPEDWQ